VADTGSPFIVASGEKTRGGQHRYSDLAIETALTLGLVFGLRLRQTEGLLGSMLALMGLDLAVPDHTTLSRRARTRQAANRRPDRQVPAHGPVHVLVDSSGLQVFGAGQWLEEKHGAKSRRGWRKLHLALDADSGEIIAHTMTDQDTSDASQVEPLLDQIDRPIEQFNADGAYDGTPIYDAVINHSADAAIVIPPRANAIERTDTKPSGQRNRHIAAISRDGRMKWQSSNVRQARAGRDRHRAIQSPHRSTPAGSVVSRPADGSRHRLRRPQPHACLRTPEIRPLQSNYRVDGPIKDPDPSKPRSMHQHPSGDKSALSTT
jgi:hypothetical protein